MEKASPKAAGRAWAAGPRHNPPQVEGAGKLRAAGTERFTLDRLVLDDDPPLSCEVERVREALGRVADFLA